VCVETGNSASATGDSMAISNAGQFGLLLWKHWLLQKRRPIATTFLIIIPVLISLLLVLARSGSDATFQPSPTLWDSFEASASFPYDLKLPTRKDVPVWPWDLSTFSNWTLVFSPNTSKAAIRMTKSVAEMLVVFSIGKITYYQRLLTYGSPLLPTCFA